MPTVVLCLLLGPQLAGSLELKAISQKGVILVSLIHHLSQVCFLSSVYSLDASIPSEYQVITFAPILWAQNIVLFAVEDFDGDQIRCRLAQSSLGECSQVCLRLLPATLDESSVSYLAVSGFVYKPAGKQITLLPYSCNGIALVWTSLSICWWIWYILSGVAGWRFCLFNRHSSPEQCTSTICSFSIYFRAPLQWQARVCSSHQVRWLLCWSTLQHLMGRADNSAEFISRPQVGHKVAMPGAALMSLLHTV